MNQVGRDQLADLVSYLPRESGLLVPTLLAQLNTIFPDLPDRLPEIFF
jgi:hypothetical protein